MTSAVDVQALLDPELAAVIAAFPIDIGALFGSLSDQVLPEVRALMDLVPRPPLGDAVARTDHRTEGGVTLRVHRPVGAEGPLPCVYWMHGGGLVLGSYTEADARFDQWCQQLPCLGMSVEYRLAPEHPYPAPLDDCYEGLAWIHRHAAELGADPERTGVAGNSAGGGLAAGLALLARDRGEYPVAFQLLIYPMLDDRQITPSSRWADPIWPPAANEYGWTSYLGAAKGATDVPAHAAAARATDLRGLPPTLISVGGLDGFSDEDIAYAVRLRHAGVPVELHVYPGAPHGFDLSPETTLARRAGAATEQWLAARLASP